MKSPLILLSTLLAATATSNVSNADASPPDAQAQAAALLRGKLTTTAEPVSTAASSQQLGDHPAVVVARTWGTRGIDPNTFLVAHPARLELVGASPSEKVVAQGTDAQTRAGR